MSRLLSNCVYPSRDVVPYSIIASQYDQVMNHVNYASWGRYIIQIIKRFGNGGHCIVDGGCGTGSMMHELSQTGYSVYGFDRSIQMILQARIKNNYFLWQGDARNLSLKCCLDVFLCLYDSIQYLTKTEIDRMLSEVSRCLSPKGLFIFDMVTECHVLKYWSDYQETLNLQEVEIFRQSWYEKKKKIQHTLFHVTDDEKRTLFKEHHKQNVYTLSEIEEIINQSDLILLGIFQDFGFKSGHETSDRIHFVLRKEIV